MDENEEYLTTSAAAAAIGVSLVTLQRWVTDKKVVPTRRTVGGHFRWRLSDLEYQLATRNDTVVAVIVATDRGVLATQRHDGVPPWGFPAGKMQPGESPEDAGVREVKEETGLLVATDRILGERIHPDTRRRMIYMTAHITGENGEPFVGDSFELADVQWLSLREVGLLMPNLYEPVADYLRHTLG